MAGTPVLAMALLGAQSAPVVSQVVHENAQLVSPGEIPVTANVSVLPGGGELYTYNFPNGEVESVPVAPVGFNPLTATPAQLSMYGFPQPPSTSAGLATWTAAMAAYQTEPAPPLVMDVPTSSIVSPTAMAAPYYSDEWSGYWAGTPGGGTKYVGVSTVFNAPDVVSPANGSCTDSASNPTSMATWVGLGGQSSDLVQEGIAWCNSVLDPNGVAEWQPFTEWVPGPNPVVACNYPSSTTVSFDNTMYLNLGYETSSNQAEFFIEDESTGVTETCASGPPSGYGFAFDGNTADFVNEAVGQNVDDLPKYDAFQFGSDEGVLAAGGSAVYLGNMSGIRDAYTGCAASYSQYAGGIHSDEYDFDQYWTGYNYTC